MRSLPLTRTRLQIGAATFFALVALRLAIGWHFFSEGASKLQNPSFSSVPFLQQAKGPLAGLYHRMIPDRYGHRRLNLDATLQDWEKFRQQVVNHFGFDDKQAAKAEDIFKRYREQLQWYFRSQRDDLEEYFNEVDRLLKAKADATTKDVDFQRQWIAGKEAELRGKLSRWTAELGSFAEHYERDLNDIASSEQKQSGLASMTYGSQTWVDTTVTWLTFLVGVGLIVGLFTRLASIAGAIFLASVIATQPPWVAGATDVYCPTVEMFALLVLAATGAGRFLGLDFFIHSLRMWCCPPKRPAQSGD